MTTRACAHCGVTTRNPNRRSAASRSRSSARRRVLLNRSAALRYPRRRRERPPPPASASSSSTGTAPLETSSSDVICHRISRAGDRQLNCRLHTMAITHISRTPQAGPTTAESGQPARAIEKRCAVSTDNYLTWSSLDFSCGLVWSGGGGVGWLVRLIVAGGYGKSAGFAPVGRAFPGPVGAFVSSGKGQGFGGQGKAVRMRCQAVAIAWPTARCGRCAVGVAGLRG